MTTQANLTPEQEQMVETILSRLANNQVPVHVLREKARAALLNFIANNSPERVTRFAAWTVEQTILELQNPSPKAP